MKPDNLFALIIGKLERLSLTSALNIQQIIV